MQQKITFTSINKIKKHLLQKLYLQILDFFQRPQPGLASLPKLTIYPFVI
jgi:hypothetical protein